jgi:hypothetical protein
MIDWNDEYQPNFKLYQHLINQQIPANYSKLNDFFFEHFFKDCFLKFGFLSIIRDIHENTLFLKVYYSVNKLCISEQKIDEFLSAFYKYEHPGLYYNHCNIIKIPIYFELNANFIVNISDINKLESLLQIDLQIKSDSWVGIDFTETKGSYTNYKPLQNKYIYQKLKQVLFDNQINQWPVNEIRTPSLNESLYYLGNNNLAVNSDSTGFKISWKIQYGEETFHTIRFWWRDVLFKLVASGKYDRRSTATVAVLEFYNHQYLFGFGRASFSGGYIGTIPEIIIGNYQMKFNFGKNYIKVFQVLVNPAAYTESKQLLNSFLINSLIKMPIASTLLALTYFFILNLNLNLFLNLSSTLPQLFPLLHPKHSIYPASRKICIQHFK